MFNYIINFCKNFWNTSDTQTTNLEKKKKIRADLFNNNYYYKYLSIEDLNYKCYNLYEEKLPYNSYSLLEAVEKNYIIHKNEIIKNCCQLYDNIYLKNKYIYKFTHYIDKQNYIYIIKYLYNNNISNLILPVEIYDEIQTGKEKKVLLQKIPYKIHGDLFGYVQSNNIINKELYTIFYKLVIIVKNLHSLNISHRDIKLENILIDFLPELELYLIDFEFACTNDNFKQFNGGTLCYAAPELMNLNIKIDNYNCVDIWALGIVLYILLFNVLPWKVANTTECTYFKEYIENPKYIYNMLSTLSVPTNYKIIYHKILMYCFNINYKERVNIKYILDLLEE